MQKSLFTLLGLLVVLVSPAVFLHADDDLDWQDYDDFNDNSLDASKWGTGYFYGGDEPDETNGRIEFKSSGVSLSADSKIPSELAALVAEDDETDPNNLLYVLDSEVYGIEADVTLPDGSTMGAAIYLQILDLSPFAGVEAELMYDGSGVKFWFEDVNTEEEITVNAQLGATYKVAIVHENNKNTVYVDDVKVAEFSATNFSLDNIGIGAFHDAGGAYTVYADNVRVLTTASTTSETTSYAPSSLTGKIYNTEMGDYLQFIHNDTGIFHYAESNFQQSEVSDVTYDWTVTGSNSGTLNTDLDETTTLTFTSETGGSYDWQELSDEMETGQGTFTLTDATTGYAPTDLEGDGLIAGDVTYLFKENGQVETRNANGSATTTTYGYLKSGENSAVLAIPAQSHRVTSTFYKLTFSSATAGSLSEGSTDSFDYFVDGTDMPSIKGWLWFDAYPWVYSNEEKDWLYFCSYSDKLYVYSVKYETWREMTKSE